MTIPRGTPHIPKVTKVPRIFGGDISPMYIEKDPRTMAKPTPLNDREITIHTNDLSNIKIIQLVSIGMTVRSTDNFVPTS